MAQVQNSRSKTARKNDVSPEVAVRLGELAAEMRELVYGTEAFPEWGTRFTEIESAGMNIGLELARLFMEQSVQEQSQHTPEEALEYQGEKAVNTGEKDASLETAAGEVNWEQPKTRLPKQRRAFFPSGEGAGE